MAPCNHEETDTHIFVHTKHASVNGMKRTLIRTVDTDVVILDVEELWIAFEVGKHLHYLSIHKIASSLNTEQCEGLPSFHALTGCDTVSLAVDTRSVVGRHSVDIAVDSRSIVGRHSVETQSIVVPDVS